MKSENIELYAACAAGAVLRLYALPGQILLDDEWHALNFVIDKPLLSLFWRQGMGANCVPDNLYSAILLRTVGWSELCLRLPSIAAGLLTLAVLPWMVRRLWGARAGAAFAWLLAVAPCAIFYSRLCRPYAKVLFFGMFALLSLCRWLRSGERRDIVMYGVGAFAAVYFHLYAAAVLLPPALVAAWLKRSARARRDLRLGAAAFALPAVIFILPPNISNPWWLDASVSGASGMRWQTLATLSRLFAGTDSSILRLLFGLLIAFGGAALYRKDRSIALALGAGVLAFALKAVSSTQTGMEVGIQIARYGLLLLPIGALCASLAFSRLPRGTAAAFAAVLFMFGPLRGTYGSINNFTNHSAFQYDYRAIDWSATPEREFFPGYVMRRESVPSAYSELARRDDVLGVIEFPMLVADHLNVLYFFQHFHRKPVAAGYLPGVRFPPRAPDEAYVDADAPISYVLNRVPPEKLHFRNIVALDDIERLRRKFAGWAIAVHRHYLNEVYPGKVRPPAGPNVAAEALISSLRRAGFVPFSDDGKLAVLLVPR